MRAERDGSFFGMIGWAGALVLYPDHASSRAGAEVEACQMLQAPPWRGPTAAQLAMSSQFSPRMDASFKKAQQNSLLAMAWHPVFSRSLTSTPLQWWILQLWLHW